MALAKEFVDPAAFNKALPLPYELRIDDFAIAMQDVYDFFHDANSFFTGKHLSRLEDFLRAQTLSGVISDMLSDSIGKHARTLVTNRQHNGHPDLIPQGLYPDNSAKSGSEGVEIKSTKGRGGKVDTHGGRDQWMCVFCYEVDKLTEPAVSRRPMRFVEIYLGKVSASDFKVYERGPLGTRTSSLGAAGITQFRTNWLYRIES